MASSSAPVQMWSEANASLPCPSHHGHPYTKFEHGADVHLYHSPSGATLHIRSCFFGDDLDEVKLKERLGDCTHLQIGQIIDLFETIEFVPASKEGEYFHADSSSFKDGVHSTKLFNALLVAKTLGLEALVQELRGFIANRDCGLVSVLEIHYSSILSLVERRQAYEAKFVRDALLLAANRCKDIFGRATIDDLFVLSEDEAVGAKFYAQLVMAIGSSVSNRLGHSMPPYLRLPNSGCMTTTHAGTKGVTVDVDNDEACSRMTRRWSPNQTDFFHLRCGLNDSICAMIEFDTGVITSTLVKDLPFIVDKSVDGVSVVSMLGDATLDSSFGQVAVGNTIIIQAPISLSDGVCHVDGRVIECSERSMKIEWTYIPMCENEDAGSVAHILGGPNAGFYYGREDPELGPLSCLFLDDDDCDADPFSGSANFVIRIPSSRPKRDTFKWRCVLVHSWVMYRRWPYFRRVIDSGMAEAATNILTLPAGFPPKLLESLVHFLYTGMHLVLSPNDKSAAERAFVNEYAEMFGFGVDELAGFNPLRKSIVPVPQPVSFLGTSDFGDPGMYNNVAFTGTVTGTTTVSGPSTNSRTARNHRRDAALASTSPTPPAPRRSSKKRWSSGKNNGKRRSRGR